MRLPSATFGSEIHSGTPAIRLGRWTLVAPERNVPNVFCPVTTFTGGAVRA